MSFLLDLSWFHYKCIDFSDKNFYFTYATDLDIEGLQHINILLFYTLQKICDNPDFFNQLDPTLDKFHPVDDITIRVRIGSIFQKYGKSKEWIQQNIVDCDYIYQIKIKDNKRRLFFILDKNNGIVKPLVIDLNHAIYRGSQKNNYKNCFICKRTRNKCRKNLSK